MQKNANTVATTPPAAGVALVPSGRLISFRELLTKTALSRAAAYRAINRGEFQRIPLSPRQSAFLESQVDDWVSAKVAAALAGAVDPKRLAVLQNARNAAAASVAARRSVATKLAARDAAGSGKPQASVAREA